MRKKRSFKLGPVSWFILGMLADAVLIWAFVIATSFIR